MDTKGWVLETRALGLNPGNVPRDDLTPLRDKGLGVMVRLNHAYYPSGTLPRQEHYQAFATCCGVYVAQSRGAHIFVLSNETNHSQEWPNGEVITPSQYARAFQMCRVAIRSQPGHENDQVVVAAVGPWNVEARYPGNDKGERAGDWLRYFADVLTALHYDEEGGFGFEGIALHTYARGPWPADVFSDAKMGPPYQDRYVGFRAFEDTLGAVPEWARSVPVYLTEMNQYEPWRNENTGWVRAAYECIHQWNQVPTHQVIRCALLYRWKRDDQWHIEGVSGVLEDLHGAVMSGYKWTSVAPPPQPRPSDDRVSEAVLDDAWEALRTGEGRHAEEIRLNPGAAFYKYAHARSMGHPKTGEHRIRVDGHRVVWQGWPRILLWTFEGEWAEHNIRPIDW